MFRKMRRFKQQLPEAECREVLREQKRGVLSMLGDDGYPYGIPMNHWYCEEEGVLYFHSAKEGHRMDAIKAYDKVSYCVHDEGWQKPGDWALNIRSVVVFGRMQLVTDEEKTRQICSSLVRKFTDDEAYLEKELKHALSRVQCLALLPEHMTGKLVNES
ncbi:pyridoxamine 5'-phosphate oxidase family protein [Selenomonas sp. KH1T6]|uniref:pyridoxamine 5'-phosphate oxidase family protein n=1 Tax=Selenomonas sp. KH1T6 TaxID=3158784 RepID=UPI0008A7BABB|nr:hypothetical protein SAMN05216583_13718 [Selenomonas ruminantium]